MSKKAFVVILVLSVVVTIGIAMFGFIMNEYRIVGGLPLQFTGFSFLGSTTNYLNLILDIAFWFVIIWGIWKATLYLSGRAGQ